MLVQHVTCCLASPLTPRAYRPCTPDAVRLGRMRLMESVTAPPAVPSLEDTPALAAASKKRKRDELDNGDTIPQQPTDGFGTIHDVWKVLKR